MGPLIVTAVGIVVSLITAQIVRIVRTIFEDFT